MKVLIVDDNVDVSTMIMEFFKLLNYDCFVTNNGKEGLGLINSNKFDAVLLDLAMPEFTGFEVLDQLCKSGEIAKNKIVVFTALALTKEDESNLMNRGVSTILKKPVGLQVLVNALNA